MQRENGGAGQELRIDRRGFVRLAAGSALCVCHALCTSPTWAGEAPADSAPTISDRLVALADPQGKTPLRVADVPLDSALVMALPLDPASGTVRDGTRLNRIVLIRTDPSTLEGPARERSVDGVLAFSAVCTHEACFVAGWLPAEGVMICPCHASKFNARAEGEVVSGPAPRALPSLPLKLLDGELAIAGAFSAAPGVKRKSE